jgi:hypothetical protein
MKTQGMGFCEWYSNYLPGQFADVEVYQLASGGIAGAEGAVTLAIKGMPDQVEKAMAAVVSVHGESPF